MKNIFKVLALTLLAVCGMGAEASAQSQGQSPFQQFGSTISPKTDTACFTFPSTVTGGCLGAGTSNFGSIAIGGSPIQGSGLAYNKIWIGDMSNVAAAQAVSGDMTISPLGVTSVTTLVHVTNGSLANAGLAHSSTTVNGVPCVLGSTCTIGASATVITVGVTSVSGGGGGFLLDNGGILGAQGSVGTGNVVRAAGPTINSLTVTGSLTATGLVTNSDLQNAATTVNGVACTLGLSCTVTAVPVYSNQSANTFLSGPSSGSPATPTFRTMAAADLPLALQNGTTATTQAATDSSGKLATTLWAQVKGGCSPIEMFGGGAGSSDNSTALTAWQATFGSSPGQFCIATGAGQLSVLTNGYTFNLAVGQSVSFLSTGPEQTQWLFPNAGDGFILNYSSTGSAYALGNAVYFENAAIVTGAQSTNCPYCSISGTTLTIANLTISAYASGSSSAFRATVPSTTGMFTGEYVFVSGATGCSSGNPNGFQILSVVDSTHVDLINTTYSSGCTGGAIAGTGSVQVGQLVQGPGVAAGTKITAGSGTSWTVNNSQSVVSRNLMLIGGGSAITINGASLPGDPMKPTTMSNAFFRGSDQFKVWNVGAKFNDVQNATLVNPTYYGFNQDYIHGTMTQYNASLGGQATNFVVINPFVTFAYAGIDAQGYFQGVSVVGGGNLARVSYGMICNAAVPEPACNFSVGQVEAEYAAVALTNIAGSQIGPALFYIGAQGASSSATAVSLVNSPLNQLVGLTITCNTAAGVTSNGMYLGSGSNANTIGSTSFQGCATALSIASGANGTHGSGITMYSNTANLVDAGTNSVIEYTDELNNTGDLLSSSLSVSFISAIPSGGSQSVGLNMTSTPHFGVFPGTGSPTMAAAQGSLYLRNDSGAVYVNNNGSTGWTQLATSTGANPSAVAGPTAINGSAATFMRSDAAPAVQKASSSQFGIVEVDNSTIASSAGVISMIALTGDVTTSGSAATLATVATGATVGSSTAIPVVTFNNKGLVMGATTVAVVAPAGTLSGSTLASGVTASSLLSVGATLTVPTGGAHSPITSVITGNDYSGMFFNGATTLTTALGIFGGGGGGGDPILYLSSPSGGSWQYRIANVPAITVNATSILVPGTPNAATTSALCFNTSTGAYSYDGTLGTCTVSALRFKTPLGEVNNSLSALNVLRPAVWKYKEEYEVAPEVRNNLDGTVTKGTHSRNSDGTYSRVEGGKGAYRKVGRLDERTHVGLYADDVEKMDKRCVGYDSDGKLNNYEDRCVIAYAIGALKELKAANDNLAAQVETLKRAVTK